MNAVHFSSRSDEWATPNWFYDLIEAELGPIDRDVCGTAKNAKCKVFYTREMDGLKQEWRGVCWCNPPYSEVALWLEKAYQSSLAGATVVCLIPARTDTIYWHRFVTKAYEIRFFKGRLKFGDAQNSAPFPSALVVFKPHKRKRGPRYRHVDLREVQRSLFGC
jgi:phage N-6-adenine-methyltransferase